MQPLNNLSIAIYHQDEYNIHDYQYVDNLSIIICHHNSKKDRVKSRGFFIFSLKEPCLSITTYLNPLSSHQQFNCPVHNLFSECLMLYKTYHLGVHVFIRLLAALRCGLKYLTHSSRRIPHYLLNYSFKWKSLITQPIDYQHLTRNISR